MSKSTTGKLSFAEFRAAISEVSLLEAALQLAATAADPGSPQVTRSAAAPQPPQHSPIDKSASVQAVPTHAESPSSSVLSESINRTPSSPADSSSLVASSRQRKNSRAGAGGMRRSRSQAELNLLDDKKRFAPTKNEAGETVVPNPLWRRPGVGSVLPAIGLKRDSLVEKRNSEGGRPDYGTARGSNPGAALKSSSDADGARSPRTSPRGPKEEPEKRNTQRRLEFGAPLSKTKSESKDARARLMAKSPAELAGFEAIAALDHLTIDLSHLSRDARLRASRDLFGPKATGAQPPVSVAVTTSTASSGLRTSDKALAQSAAEALRTSKGLRNSDSALHASTRNIAAAVAHQANAHLRTSRSSEDLRKAMSDAGVAALVVQSAHTALVPVDSGKALPRAATLPAPVLLGPSASSPAPSGSKDHAGAEPLSSASMELLPPSRPQQQHQSPARDPALALPGGGRASRSGSDVLRPGLLGLGGGGGGSSPDSSGASSPQSPSPVHHHHHQRRSSAGSVERTKALKGDDGHGQSPASIGRDSSGELRLTQSQGRKSRQGK